MPVDYADTFVFNQLKAKLVMKLAEQLQMHIFTNFYKLCTIDKSLNKSMKVFKNFESTERILVIIVSLQKIFVRAQEELDENKKSLLKEKYLIERIKIENILNKLQFQNNEEKKLRDNILENIKLLYKQIIVSTLF